VALADVRQVLGQKLRGLGLPLGSLCSTAGLCLQNALLAKRAHPNKINFKNYS